MSEFVKFKPPLKFFKFGLKIYFSNSDTDSLDLPYRVILEYCPDLMLCTYQTSTKSLVRILMTRFFLPSVTRFSRLLLPSLTPASLLHSVNRFGYLSYNGCNFFYA